MNMVDDRAKVALAAGDNARWCDAVCRAHGGSTCQDAVTWRNRTPSPPFYPNLVTLREDAQSEVARAVRKLDPALGGGWSVKDSFADLDLAPLGFQCLFEAAWLWRDADAAAPTDDGAEGLRWERAATPGQLADWERSWESGLGDVGSPRAGGPRFPPALLARDDVAFCMGWRDGRIVAGGVLSAGAGVVGISNCFAAAPDLGACWRGLVREAGRRFPGMAQCGYDRQPRLAHALAQGFAVVGPLRVWLREREGG